MINIIICDDCVNDVNKIEKIVKGYFKNLEYSIYKYYDFNKEFFKIIDLDLENKIYLLDIETPSGSGIDIARRIRKNDYSSVIIFLSGHDDLSRIVAKKNIMCLNFINKYDNLKNNLKSSLELALTIVGKKRRVKLCSRGVVYNIDIDSILYITKETISRNTVLICDNNTYYLKMSMKNVIEKLTNDFIQIHRACFINRNRVAKIDTKLLEVTFDNNITTNLVSTKYIEGMMYK